MLLLTTTILRCPSELFNRLISLRSNWLVLSNYISVLLRCAIAQLPNPLRVLSKTQPAAEVIGYWRLGIGNGLGYAALTISVPLHATPYTLRFTPKATATTPHHLSPLTSSPLASNLSPLTFCLIASFPANRQCFDAAAKGRCRSDTK